VRELAEDSARRPDGTLSQHVEPGQLPWEASRAVLELAVHGARLTSTFDTEALRAVARGVVAADGFGAESPLLLAFQRTADDGGTAHAEPVLLSPPDDVTTWDGYVEWTKRKVPASVSPEWLGIPAEAASRVQQSRGEQVLEAWALVRAASVTNVAGSDQNTGEEALQE